MKYRLFILLILVLGFATRGHAQNYDSACAANGCPPLNCSTGQYNITADDYTDGGCPVVNGTDNGDHYDVTDVRTANNSCRSTVGAPDGGGIGYAWSTSTVTGTGDHYCFAGQGYVCNPFMYIYERDGGTTNPDGSPSDSLENRFYNQAYNTTFSYTGNPCPQNGAWQNGFRQCSTIACGPPPCGPDGGTRGNPCSPIIIDVGGNGFQLTNAQTGVKFDITGANLPVQIAWTAPGAQNAFLCLPDGDGKCDDGRDLFGNFTQQPASATPNGFAALAVYDANGDGVIDAQDAIFSSLRLWIDANHDGVSQPSELFTLPQLGVTSISLKYKEDKYTDQFGNQFRYRAKIGSTYGERWAYDVFLVAVPTTTAAKVCPPRPLAPKTTERRTLLR